jgi:hypothetical protein
VRHTCEILKLENINEDGCYVHLYFSMINCQISAHWICPLYLWGVLGIRFSSIRRDSKYTFTLLFIFLPSPIGGDPGDYTTIYSLLLSTYKVREGDSSRHQIGPLPIGFVPPLHRRGNSIVFNLVFCFPSFFYIASWFIWSRYS